jgi:formylglycine-generating enzyme required for sulfatase activity
MRNIPELSLFLWLALSVAPVLAAPRPPAIDPTSGVLMAFVEEPGNPADNTGLGAVSSSFRISALEITHPQWVEFLNAVAAADPNQLYNPGMTSSDRSGVLRSGTPGNYSYSIKPNFENKPINWTNWYDGARYCNWLQNGRPGGAQDASTTEDGAYDMSLSGDLIARKPGARYFIPTHDEWYKAAYYDPFDPGADAGGSVDYWSYPNRSDASPALALATVAGDVANPGPNVANTDKGADWNGENGNVTNVGGTTSVSPWGVFDLAGNVNEATETLGTPIPPNPPAQPEPLPTRKLRGGDFASQTVLAINLPGVSGSLNMEAAGANIGLRIAARFCLLPPDPPNLRLTREGGDLLLSWDDPGQSSSWNVYRDPTADPQNWLGPVDAGVVDEDAGTAGVQYRDVGAIALDTQFYLIAGNNLCGESPLR